MMTLFVGYRTPQPVALGGYCDARDLCPDYSRPWDAVYTWLYWVSAGAVAEVIIFFLPDRDITFDDKSVLATAPTGDALTAPLLNGASATSPRMVQSATENGTTTYGTQVEEMTRQQTGRSLESLESERTAGQRIEEYHAFIVNGLGCFLAAVTVAITSTLFYEVFTNAGSMNA
jgi:hypothetical protein